MLIKMYMMGNGLMDLNRVMVYIHIKEEQGIKVNGEEMLYMDKVHYITAMEIYIQDGFLQRRKMVQEYINIIMEIYMMVNSNRI